MVYKIQCLQAFTIFVSCRKIIEHLTTAFNQAPSRYFTNHVLVWQGEIIDVRYQFIIHLANYIVDHTTSTLYHE